MDCPEIGNGHVSPLLQTNGHSSPKKNGHITNGTVVVLPPPVFQDEDTICGFLSFRPGWLQYFANKKAFLSVFCLTSVLQGMYYTYFVSVLTTIEKLFQIPSKTTGIIMSATEIGQIGGALLLTYYGGQGHRPKWISFGMLIFAFASILCSMPHFIFGGSSIPQPIPTAELNISQITFNELSSQLCYLGTQSPSLDTNDTNDTLDNSELWTPPPEVLTQRKSYKAARCESPEETSRHKTVTSVVLTLFFVSLLFIGIGATAVYTLGIPYIDDNIATRESPLYFGITIGVRIFGPVFGFLLGSLCTSVHVNFPKAWRGKSPDDPQWIGAWWLGVFIVGTCLIVTSFPMMAFPRNLPHRGSNLNKSPLKLVKTSKKRPSIKYFPSAIKRLLKNKVLLFRTASSVLHILPIAGLYTFLPKYLESQFQLTANKANMISGLAGILVMGFGIFASGSFMRKYKPNARFVARWITLATLAYSFGMIILMWLGCPINNFVGLNAGREDLITQPTCNSTCGCRPGEFFPVCSTQGVTYLSPCLAGCTKLQHMGDNEYIFTDCLGLNQTDVAHKGFCPLQCNNLIWYIIIFSIFVLIYSTSEVGSMLLTLRCVDPQDKAMALGLISFAIGLFGNVPCPVIYGAVVDSACLFWEDNCGEPGACRVYDPDKFRIVFHGLTAIIMFAAFIVDAIIWYRADAIQFNEDEPPALPEEKEPMKVIVKQIESSL